MSEERVRVDTKKETLGVSQTIALAALGVACLSLIGSIVTIYFSFLDNSEDLKVTVAPVKLQQIGTDSLDTIFVFSNAGRRAAVIERVLLCQVEGGEITGVKMTTGIADHLEMILGGFQTIGRLEDKMEFGTLTYREPEAVQLNNADIANPSFFVPPNSVTLLQASFKPKKIDDLKKASPMEHSFLVRFYDRTGKRKHKHFRGWTLNAGDYITVESNGVPVRLLPAS